MLVRDAPGLGDVFDQTSASGRADLGRGDVAAEQLQTGLLGRVDDAFQARVNRGQQIALAIDAPCLVGDQLAAAADQQPDLGIDLARRIDRPQIAPLSDLIGDHARVSGIAFVLAADRALTRAVDRQARDVHDRDPGLGEHRAQQSGDPADDVDADPQRPVLGAQPPQLVDQRGQRVRPIVDAAVQQQLATGRLDRRGPLELLGDIDPDSDCHPSPPHSVVQVKPLSPDLALQSDDPQCLISGDREAARQGEQPPEPSRAASMKTIPVSPTLEGRAA